MMDREELRQAAGSYVAGDLDSDDKAGFEDLLSDDQDLREEVAFWERMREVLPEQGRPAATAPEPTVGMLAVVHRRAAAEAEREAFRGSGMNRAAAWSGWLVAAAATGAVFVLLSMGFGRVAEGSVAFNEFGHELVSPRHPLMSQSRFAMQQGRPSVGTQASEDSDEVFRPWLGVWTRPVNLVHNSIDADMALQVVRVVEAGPAHKAGLVPGDVLLNFGNCPTVSQFCIIKALSAGGFDGGDRVPLRYWRPVTDAIVDGELTLARVIE